MINCYTSPINHIECSAMKEKKKESSSYATKHYDTLPINVKNNTTPILTPNPSRISESGRRKKSNPHQGIFYPSLKQRKDIENKNNTSPPSNNTPHTEACLDNKHDDTIKTTSSSFYSPYQFISRSKTSDTSSKQEQTQTEHDKANKANKVNKANKDNKQKKLIKCDFCGKFYHNRKSLNKHKIAHTNPDLLQCHICRKSFSSIWAKKRHIEEHVKSTVSIKCKICEIPCRTKYQLKEHMQSSHTNNIFVCVYCDDIFLKQCNLNRHKKKHTNTNKFKCDKCVKGYHFSSLLKFHMEQVHDKIINHTCDICKKGFYSKGGFNRHMKIHT